MGGGSVGTPRRRPHLRRHGVVAAVADHYRARDRRLAAGRARLVERLKMRSRDGFRITVAADGEGSAARITNNLRDEGFVAPEVIVAPLERGVILPNSKVALLAESDITGRRRAHRTARP